MQLKNLFTRTRFNVRCATNHYLWSQRWCSSVITESNPEVPSLFQKLFSDRIIRETFEENSSNLSNGLNIIHNYDQYGDRLQILNDFSSDPIYLNDIISYLMEHTYSEDLHEFIIFCDELNLFKYITIDNMENILDALLNSGRTHDTINIGLKYNDLLTSSMHETIGMAICSTPWTDTLHYSLHYNIIQWFKILTKQYVLYFNNNKNNKNNLDIDWFDNDENINIPLLRPKFESFFVYIIHLLARDGVYNTCKQILKVIEPIIINFESIALEYGIMTMYAYFGDINNVELIFKQQYKPKVKNAQRQLIFTLITIISHGVN
eukprot:509584_1